MGASSIKYHPGLKSYWESAICGYVGLDIDWLLIIDHFASCNYDHYNVVRIEEAAIKDGSW